MCSICRDVFKCYTIMKGEVLLVLCPEFDLMSHYMKHSICMSTSTSIMLDISYRYNKVP